MTTTLTLDAPGASEALGRAYALLRRWSAEARQQETGIGDDLGGTTPTPAYTPAPNGQDAGERIAR
jgi:hypothetical protein